MIVDKPEAIFTLKGYTCATFGDDEKSSVRQNIATNVGVPVEAVTVRVVDGCGSAPSRRRRLHQDGSSVTVEATVDTDYEPQEPGQDIPSKKQVMKSLADYVTGAKFEQDLITDNLDDLMEIVPLSIPKYNFDTTTIVLGIVVGVPMSIVAVLGLLAFFLFGITFFKLGSKSYNRRTKKLYGSPKYKKMTSLAKMTLFFDLHMLGLVHMMQSRASFEKIIDGFIDKRLSLSSKV